MELEVIIVDDNHMTRLLHREIVSIAGLGVKVPAFANGKDGLFYLYQRPNPKSPILVLLDINMPIMNGWDFLDGLPKMEGNEFVLVTVVSSSVDGEDRIKAFTYPNVIEYLEKPIKPSMLTDLKKLVDQKLVTM